MIIFIEQKRIKEEVRKVTEAIIDTIPDELQVCSAFDKTLPDPVIPEGEIWIHYNVNKVKSEYWDKFNKNGHGAINHHFGGDDRLSFYKQYGAALIPEDMWDEIRMHMIIDTLWYQLELRNPD